MANPRGLFAPELLPEGWFDETLRPEGWFSADFLEPSSPPVSGGLIKVWLGSSWGEKPVKFWNGSAWVQKPLKFWTGAAWTEA